MRKPVLPLYRSPLMRPSVRLGCAVLSAAAFVGLSLPDGRTEPSRTDGGVPVSLQDRFGREVAPFLRQNCIQCHNEDLATAGVRLDRLDATLPEASLHLWEVVLTRVGEGSMPPDGARQPEATEREHFVEWVGDALDFARRRPPPRNGVVRRLTVSQYRNTVRQLLHLKDDLATVLPPDAISRDGFVNNTETLDLSPLLMEAYFRIAEDALDRAIVDPAVHPAIQSFRVDLGRSVNSDPLPDKLILGANSLLLDNEDFVVHQVRPVKPFDFEPFRMRTKYRFIEGYKGNATVRGWRDYDSIYHAVFACMRGSTGYPKGAPYETVPEGLLLRPAIPSDEVFGLDSTYGPKANFKISLRELPDYGHFRVTVTAAKYNDALLLGPGVPSQPLPAPEQLVLEEPGDSSTVEIPATGIYQVDLHEVPRDTPAPADPPRLEVGLAGRWDFDGGVPIRLEGDAALGDSPFGQALYLDGEDDWAAVAAPEVPTIGADAFTVAAWVHPEELQLAGLVAVGGFNWKPGWALQLSSRGIVSVATIGPDTESNGRVSSPEGVVRKGVWQHVAAVVRRGADRTMLYVNGYPVARGGVGPADLGSPGSELLLGRVPEGPTLHGALDDVRIYGRALDRSEIQGLVEPGAALATAPEDKPQEVTLTLGDRQFTGLLPQPAFLVARLEAGDLRVDVRRQGVKDLDRVVMTELHGDHELVRQFLAFERRNPTVGVHLGLRRDCGSTLAPVGPPQSVESHRAHRFVFEGAIRDFPSPEVEKDNVNYLAGIREIGVRSEYTDGRDRPRLAVRSVAFEGPLYESWPPASHRGIFTDSELAGETPAYAREVLHGFATRAFRRPVTREEETTLMAVFGRAREQGASFRASIRDALQVVLTSPQFLFLVETSDTPDPEPVRGHELASKLSYFLWDGPPDRKLLDLADRGELGSQINGEVRRMVEDPRFERFVDAFASQWLSLEKLDVLEPDRERFPRLTYHVRSQLRREPVELLKYLIRANLPVRHLVRSEFLMVNEVVASYYDMADASDSGFAFLPIRHESEGLGGLLTQAALMAGLSDGRESNPVKRGAWLARKIVAEPPDDPPPNVPDLEESTVGLPLRERLERHRSQPGCRQCHAKIDPWGVPFEQVDAGGRLKQVHVDASSTLPDGTAVSGVGELKSYLVDERIDQVAFSVLKHLLAYANGRSLSYGELDYLKRDALSLENGGYRMQDMVRYVVNSPLFLEK